MRVIINADDLGISSTVNKSIDEFLKKGVITSATILANGEAFGEVIDIVKKYPNASFGVHLNLTEFESLTKSTELSRCGIITSEGQFIKGSIRKVHITKDLKRAIYFELKAQISKIKEAGIPISHFDGHHHCHLQPQLFGVIQQLAKEFGVRRIRQNAVRPLFFGLKKINQSDNQLIVEKGKDEYVQKTPPISLRLINAIKSRYWYYRIKYSYITTDLFFSYSFFEMNKESFKTGKELTIELMCHPGHPNYKIESNLILENGREFNTNYKIVNFMDLGN